MKKLLILLILALAMVGAVNAAITTDYILEAWYFDEGSGSVAVGNKSIMNFSVGNEAMWVTGYNGTGIMTNESLNAELVNTYLPGDLSPSNNTQFLWCSRIYWFEQNTETDSIMSIGSNNYATIDTYPEHPVLRARFDNQSGSNNNGDTNNHGMQLYQWYSVCGGYNETHNMLFINGTFIDAGLSGNQKYNLVGQYVRIGEGSFNGNDAWAIFDEVVVFNESNQEVVDYYESTQFRGYSEPTINVVVTDFTHWYNFTDNSTGYWLDYNSSGIDLDVQDTYLESSSSQYCHGDIGCYGFTSGTMALDQFILADNDENISLTAQFNLPSTTHTSWDGIIGDQDKLHITWSNSNTIICGIQQDTGTQYPTGPTVIASPQANTSYVVTCQVNASHICGGVNGGALTCTARGGTDLHSSGWFRIGRNQASEEIYLYSNGVVTYDRWLNDSERDELYYCLSNRTSIISGCRTPNPTIDTTSPVADQGVPVDNANLSADLSFTLKCSDETEVDSLVLYTNKTGIWAATATNSSPIDDTYWRITGSPWSDGSYIWAAYCNDTSGNDNWTVNRSFTVDTTPPGLITDLANYSRTSNSIYWNWTNPSDTDFDYANVYLDDIYRTNTSNNYYNATGLTNSTSYTIQIRSVDIYGNVNTTWVNSTAITSYLAPTPQTDFTDGVILNVTFNNESNLSQDFSYFTHLFTTFGSPSYAEGSACKWYGCANLSETSGDYFRTQTQIDLNDTLAISWWVLHNTAPGASLSHMYYLIDGGTDTTQLFTQQGSYGLSTGWDAETGGVGWTAGESYRDSADNWVHYFLEYDGNFFAMWQDGVLVKNDTTDSYGNLNDSIGDYLYVGVGRYGIDVEGYLDEFVMWDRGNFSSADVLEYYSRTSSGTPPDLDLYVSNISYTLPYDWSDANNSIITGGTMDIDFKAKNQGALNDSNLYAWKLTIDGVEVCNGTNQTDKSSETSITCTWTTSVGMHAGYITLDYLDNNTEDVESNNVRKFYIPFMSRPWVLFNLTEWNEDYYPYCLDSANNIAYLSCNRYRSFVSDRFDNSWTGDSVDPRGKKGRENAIGCLINGYNPANTQCIYALEHVRGWANRTISTYSNVQAIHELAHVGLMYDIMFPMLTEEDHILFSKQYYDIAMHITNLVEIDQDNDDSISGGNGWGFGSGMGMFVYTMLGDNPGNPTLIQILSDNYNTDLAIDEWMRRDRMYLNGYKNDPWAKYQEGWNYKFYSQFHMVENIMFQKRYDLNNMSQYQNTMCAMGREFVTDMLDYNYNGNILRNGESRLWRGVQRGDSNSYEDPGSDSIIGWTIVDVYAYLCNDVVTKKSLLYLRNVSANIGTATWSVLEPIYFKQALGSLTPQSPETLFPKTIYDNANDIFTIRTNYTYRNDTVIEIDGGEERGGGHSQAQGYYLYALGEPFIDYEQVPYEDDVRMDVWKNGVSMQNTSQTVEGTEGNWLWIAGQYAYNQYYGNADVSYYSIDYPNFRTFPIQYGGDIEDYIGSYHADFAGAYVYRPYYNVNDPVEEKFIKYGDMLVKYTNVTGNNEGKLYENMISLSLEFNATISGTNRTLSRLSNGSATGAEANLKTQLLYNTSVMNLAGGATPIQACKAKTDCSGSNRLDSAYRLDQYYNDAEGNIAYIIAHTWYYTGSEQHVTGTTDANGDYITINGDRRVVYDTNDNGLTVDGTKETDGWGLVSKGTEEIGAFNATYLDAGSFNITKTNNSMSIFVERGSDQIIVHANTMQRSLFIDTPQRVQITVNTQDLTNRSNFTVKKNGTAVVSLIDQGVDYVTFDMRTDQNSDYYVITASDFVEDSTAPDTVTGLSEDSYNNTWIYWTWTNPSSPDFDHVEVYLSGEFKANTSNNYYNATSLTNNTAYTLSLRTVDTSGNINTSWVNDSAVTDNYAAPSGDDGDDETNETEIPAPSGGGGSSYKEVAINETVGLNQTNFTLKATPVLKQESFISKYMPDFSGWKTYLFWFGIVIAGGLILFFAWEYIFEILKAIGVLLWWIIRGGGAILLKILGTAFSWGIGFAAGIGGMSLGFLLNPAMLFLYVSIAAIVIIKFFILK